MKSAKKFAAAALTLLLLLSLCGCAAQEDPAAQQHDHAAEEQNQEPEQQMLTEQPDGSETGADGEKPAADEQSDPNTGAPAQSEPAGSTDQKPASDSSEKKPASGSSSDKKEEKPAAGSSTGSTASGDKKPSAGTSTGSTATGDKKPSAGTNTGSSSTGSTASDDKKPATGSTTGSGSSGKQLCRVCGNELQNGKCIYLHTYAGGWVLAYFNEQKNDVYVSCITCKQEWPRSEIPQDGPSFYKFHAEQCMRDNRPTYFSCSVCGDSVRIPGLASAEEEQSLIDAHMKQHENLPPDSSWYAGCMYCLTQVGGGEVLLWCPTCERQLTYEEMVKVLADGSTRPYL